MVLKSLKREMYNLPRRNFDELGDIHSTTATSIYRQKTAIDWWNCLIKYNAYAFPLNISDKEESLRNCELSPLCHVSGLDWVRVKQAFIPGRTVATKHSFSNVLCHLDDSKCQILQYLTGLYLEHTRDWPLHSQFRLAIDRTVVFCCERALSDKSSPSKIDTLYFALPVH